ncbi:hypothetical protein K438DRAFT_1944849, partial [Mycena galopus ATCC 62051]
MIKQQTIDNGACDTAIKSDHHCATTVTSLLSSSSMPPHCTSAAPPPYHLIIAPVSSMSNSTHSLPFLSEPHGAWWLWHLQTGVKHHQLPATSDDVPSCVFASISRYVSYSSLPCQITFKAICCVVGLCDKNEDTSPYYAVLSATQNPHNKIMESGISQGVLRAPFLPLLLFPWFPPSHLL